MEKLEEKENTRVSYPQKSETRDSVLSFFSAESDSDTKEEISKSLQQIVNKFLFQSPLQSIITKFCNNTINDYVFHTKIYLEYDEENAFIFIFKNSLVFTHLFDEKYDVTENPIIYIVKFKQIYFYDLEINESEGNYIIIQFYEHDYSKKSEIKLNFKFLKDSYFIHHFIKKYFTLFWQKTIEENVLSKGGLSSQIYNCHFYVRKMNIWRNLQDRMLLVTNEFMLNIISIFKKDEVKFEKIKWADAIASVTKIGIIQNNMNELRVYYDEKLNKEISKYKLGNSKLLKGKKSRDFMFKSANEKNNFLFILKGNFFKAKDQHLLIEAIKVK